MWVDNHIKLTLNHLLSNPSKQISISFLSNAFMSREKKPPENNINSLNAPQLIDFVYQG